MEVHTAQNLLTFDNLCQSSQKFHLKIHYDPLIYLSILPRKSGYEAIIDISLLLIKNFNPLVFKINTCPIKWDLWYLQGLCDMEYSCRKHLYEIDLSKEA